MLEETQPSLGWMLWNFNYTALCLSKFSVLLLGIPVSLYLIKFNCIIFLWLMCVFTFQMTFICHLYRKTGNHSDGKVPGFLWSQHISSSLSSEVGSFNHYFFPFSATFKIVVFLFLCLSFSSIDTRYQTPFSPLVFLWTLV